MKPKLHLTTMMFLLVAIAMAAQPKGSRLLTFETKNSLSSHETDAYNNSKIFTLIPVPKQALAANTDNLITVTCIKDCDENVFHPHEWGYNFLDQEGNLYQYYGYDSNNEITIPQGKYDVLAFYLYSPAAFRHHCLVIHEQVDLNNDTTVSINPNEADNRIQFIPYLPNGEKCSPGTVFVNDDYSQDVIEEGNIGTLDFTMGIFLREGYSIFGMGSQWDKINSMYSRIRFK